MEVVTIYSDSPLAINPGSSHSRAVFARSAGIIASAIAVVLLVGCASNPPTPTYGPFTSWNGAGAPIDQNGIPIIGTPWRP